MRKVLAPLLALPLVATAAVSCNGITGDQLITFPAYAAGAADASKPFTVEGGPPNNDVFTVQLTFAQMYVGAVYINEAPPSTGFNSPICTNPGIYAAQVPFGVEVNLLSTALQPFGAMEDGGTSLGSGTADLGQSAELWLTDGDVNNLDNNENSSIPNTVDLQGTARRQSDGTVFTWMATVNINQANDGNNNPQVGLPGAYPICKERIVLIGGIDLQLFANGQFVLTIDPRGWFLNTIDFSTLPSVSTDACELDPPSPYVPASNAEYCIPDTSTGTGLANGLGGTQGHNLYTGITTGGPAAYTLSFSKLQ